MWSWALTFLLIALIAAVCGVSSITATMSQIAWIFCTVFVLAFVISVVTGRRSPVV